MSELEEREVLRRRRATGKGLLRGTASEQHAVAQPSPRCDDAHLPHILISLA
jgi:hypothetical protein